MDKIANMLITITNGGIVGRKTVTVPYSTYLFRVASVLFESGFIASYEKKRRDSGDVLEIGVLYRDGAPRVSGAKRISKLSRRVYINTKKIAPVKYGKGMVVLSTPKGVMSGKTARKEMVGGEVLFEIW